MFTEVVRSRIVVIQNNSEVFKRINTNLKKRKADQALECELKSLKARKAVTMLKLGRFRSGRCLDRRPSQNTRPAALSSMMAERWI